MKKIFALIMTIVLLVGMISGCAGKKQETNNDVPNNGGNNVSLMGNTVTISELKAKYGETDAGKVLPLYNLDPSEPLFIPLKYTASDQSKILSIHTDEKCLDESKIMLMISPDSYMPDGPKTYEIKPLSAPLTNSTTSGLWGNVSNYYIKFYYDIAAETETKLDTPVIVPMSIQSPVAIPNVEGKVVDGNFVLEWTPVEGATSYRIYQCQSFEDMLGNSNRPPKGKENAYASSIPLLEKEVSSSTLSYSDWLNNGKNGQVRVEDSEVIGGFAISSQNQGVSGEYYVTAVVGGKESRFSVGVATWLLPLPDSIADDSDNFWKTYETKDDLPKTVNVVYIDGSEKQHNVSYKSGSSTNVLTYMVEGTSLTGHVRLENNSEAIDIQNNDGSKTNGFVETKNDIPQNAPTDLPTVNDGKTPSSDASPMPPVDEPDAPPDPPEPPVPPVPDTPSAEPDKEPTISEPDKPTPENTVVEQQIENTDKVLMEANKETVTVVDGFIVTASSAAEEYLARSMIAGKENISIAAFPEIQSWATLSDVLNEVIYQNPLILGVSRYGYNYGTMTLIVEYKYSANEIETRQQEIVSEGKKIIESIITANMNDSEKRRAIYNYLEANTSYDDAALENAEQNNFQKTDEKYRDSFSTYGILVKKVGVCQSYAYAFDYLCSLAGVECILVTGDIMGYLPHAWNKVKIGNEWFVVDVTNNEKSLGIKDFMYENPDNIATALGYIEDDLFYTDDEKNVYVSSDDKYSKYKNCTIESLQELESYLKDNVKANANIEFVAMYEGFSSDDVISALRKTSITELGSSKIICGYVWFEVVK